MRRIVPAERGLRESDRDWLLTRHQHGAGFVIVVSEDLSWQAYALGEQPGAEMVMANKLLSVQEKGVYATLVSGFWMVRDRMHHVHLKDGIQKCVAEMQERAQNGISCIGEARQLDLDELPPHIPDVNYVSAAIAVLDKLSTLPAAPIAGTDFETIRRCTKVSGAVRAVAKAQFPGRLLSCVGEPQLLFHTPVFAQLRRAFDVRQDGQKQQ